MLDRSIVYAVAIIMGIILCFRGVKAVRIFVGLAFAGFLGYLGFAYTLLATHSLILSIVVFLLLSAIGLAVGFAVFKLAVSLIFAYIVAKTLFPMVGESNTLLIVMGALVLAAMAYTLVDYVLAAGLALAGSALIFKGLTGLGLVAWASLLVALACFAVGFYTQAKEQGREK